MSGQIYWMAVPPDEVAQELQNYDFNLLLDVIRKWGVYK